MMKTPPPIDPPIWSPDKIQRVADGLNASRQLEGADPLPLDHHLAKRAEADEDAAFLAAHHPIVVGRIEFRETQSETDARTLAAYAFALADGKVLAGFEFTNLAEVGARYGMAALPESRFGELPTPVINWLDAQARRQADRHDAAQARMRTVIAPSRPRLARLWAFLTGAAS